jgi:two-component system, OmpR family, response regulator
MENISLLFVEDDTYLGLIVTDYFESKGFKVFYSDNAEKGFQAFRNNKIDLCLLDVSLPGKDGFTLAEEIKSIDNDIPIIFLTAQKEKESVIKGFTLGADDYIRKPFLPDEVYLRVRSVLNRTYKNINKTNTIFNIGKYIFDYKFQTLNYVGLDKVLSYKEAELLKLLFENRNEVITKETIFKKVWDSNDLGLSRSVDVYVTKLRKHLENDKDIQIVNVRGVGYKMLVEGIQ